jgi:tetratricopeptide (TPR) repeat protein
MNPVMRAARVFLAEAEALWRERPGRVLPLAAEPSDRDDLVSALRLGELAPENRRPLFLHEAPFTDAEAYFGGFAASIERDYEAVRKGVAAEGVELPAFSLEPRARAPMDRAVLCMERAAALLGERFGGATFALVSAHVEDAPAWRESVCALAAAPRTPRVRLAVYAPPGGPLDGVLGEDAARFHVDEDELMGFIAEMDGDAPQAPGTELRGLLLAAAASTKAHEHTVAAQRYEEAAALCAAHGLVSEEAMARMGLGGAYLAAGKPDLAVESYGKAAALAEGEEAWTLGCQAWLGLGGAHLLEGAHALAAVSYRAAAEAASRADVPPLRAQALRMTSTCLEHLGHDSEAEAARLEAEALERTAHPHLPIGERPASTPRPAALPFVEGDAAPARPRPPAPPPGREAAVRREPADQTRVGARVPAPEAVLPFAPPGEMGELPSVSQDGASSEGAASRAWPEGEGLEDFGIERYAALCVDSTESGIGHDELLREYRLTAVQKAALDAYWRQRMAEDTAIWLAWDRACTARRSAGTGE